MSHKSLILAALGALFLSAALIPIQVRAGGVCGGAYTVEAGDTVEKLAAMCGTSTSAIFAANSGLTEPLVIGRVIIIPGANYGTPSPTPTMIVTPIPTTAPPGIVINNYYYYGSAPITNGTYAVQPGDTFAGIAYSFGVSITDLQTVNPSVTDINVLYVGQVLNIPYWYVPDPGAVAPPTVVAATVEPAPLSYKGTIPNGAAEGVVYLVNKTGGEAYISLRTTRGDGTYAINEFPVRNKMDVDIPAGWIDYVAWVGGVKFTGGFMLHEDDPHTITFQRSKVVVD